MKNTFVTQPLMPPLEEFEPYLRAIWESKILTNSGPFHQELEERLAAYLGVKHISLFSNATVALVVALQALRIGGEVITTPYSFVATAHSLLWNGIKPVFVDIEPSSFGIDPKLIEASITPQTTAIMPVHVYGYPCDIAAIEKIADNYGLKIVFDAAHAFGIRSSTMNILESGDLSVLSFHATKVFNTFEGGAIISRNAKMKQRIDRLKNFGFVDETTVVAPGINGKMNELQAAFGLLQLNYIDAAIDQRRQVDEHYRIALADITGIVIPEPPPLDQHNYSYFPILITEDYPLGRDAVYTALKSQGIFARRYFYPLITDFPMYRSLPSATTARLPIATRIAAQVLCLPIFPGLDVEIIDRISSFLRR